VQNFELDQILNPTITNKIAIDWLYKEIYARINIIQQEIF